MRFNEIGSSTIVVDITAPPSLLVSILTYEEDFEEVGQYLPAEERYKFAQRLGLVRSPSMKKKLSHGKAPRSHSRGAIRAFY